MKYSVKPLRVAGLEARWTCTSGGAPCMVVRYPKATEKHQRETWWMVNDGMWKAFEKATTPMGIIEAFNCHTMLGNFFSIPI